MTTLRGIFPNPKPPLRKNFIQENVRNLRRMEQYFHASREVEDLDKLKLQNRQGKYQNVAARVNSSLHRSRRRFAEENHSAESRENVHPLERKSSAPELRNNATTVATPNRKKKINNKSRVTSAAVNGKQKPQEENGNDRMKRGEGEPQTLPKVPLNLDSAEDRARCDNNCDISKYKSKGIQTLDTDNLEGIYAEGVVRYPSARSLPNNEEGADTDEPLGRSDEFPVKNQKSRKKPNSSPSKETTDCLKLNKEKLSVASKMAAQLNNGVLPPNYRKGVVPKYIKERKEERQQEKERQALEEAILAECPDGHVPLPDNERRETLKLLKKNYQELVNELNMLPIRSDTLRSQRRKIEIERQLTKLEEGIKVFSRPKVFVKINA
ncbi:uncharacterized protein LOC107035644 [Diachasma alloeum]|uniref:uncharacterized protein LOC107035644 n=1 Tax=Diachasma alloeum TaxID=454923 RepID=UPI0007384C04|nr:uncharacterized protein LOC107035644 [Diachasma alloeum]XP_015108648.1 uncharacterized protein LOC107035644 [Diachasma alloeum]XP_015108649.1 uncharacterized protein LOC107035644 [Diachasma alloeum]XP_015108651.1 uncharacterized protein LOC107035644 [Diachasma alloeum]